MLNRRGFFSMIAGALGAIALPWKAKASVVVAGEGPSYPAGVKMGIYEGTTISARISPEEYAILTKIIEKYRREWKAQRDAYLSRPI
jgi:hypothetical protein